MSDGVREPEAEVLTSLKALLEESGALWGHELELDSHGDRIAVRCDASTVTVRLEVDNPVARWWIETAGRAGERPCGSVLEVLSAVRRAL